MLHSETRTRHCFFVQAKPQDTFSSEIFQVAVTCAGEFPVLDLFYWTFDVTVLENFKNVAANASTQL